MKTINKIIGIFGIALLAIATVGAVSAEPVERTVLGNAWIQDVGVTDDFDYFIYDGTEDAVSASPAPIRKYIAGDLTRDQIDELLNEIGGNQNIGGTEKIIVGINHDADDDYDSASETHDDPSADRADDHSDSESKNVNTGLNPNVGKEIVLF